jgi:hypothetical protein
MSCQVRRAICWSRRLFGLWAFLYRGVDRIDASHRSHRAGVCNHPRAMPRETWPIAWMKPTTVPVDKLASALAAHPSGCWPAPAKTKALS